MKKMLLLTAAVALALAACGGAAGPSTSLHVTMTDFSFTPNSFTVPAGQEITVEITNNGAVTHSFIIMKSGNQVATHFTEADKANIYWQVAAIPPGESKKDTFTAPAEAGQYQILCDIAGHFEAGMVAKLTVVSEQ